MINYIRKIWDLLVVKKRLNGFLLFLMLSFFISLLIKLSNNYTQTLTFDLISTHTNPDEMLLDKSHALEITLTAKGFQLVKYYLNPRKIEIDFRELEKTEDAYIWDIRSRRSSISSNFESNTIIESIQPNQINFSFKRQFSKTVPVVVRSSINYAIGFDSVDELMSWPDSITITGTPAVLKTIETISTQELRLDQVNQPIATKVPLDIFKSSPPLRYSQTEVEVRANVEKFTEGTVQVPVRLINVPQEVEVLFFPKSIPVVFYTSLEAYNSITPESFTIECDFNATAETTTTLIPKLQITNTLVKSAKLRVNQLEYVITEADD